MVTKKQAKEIAIKNIRNRMNKIIGWILWKLGFAIKIIDDIKIIDFHDDGFHYIPKKFHYELK